MKPTSSLRSYLAIIGSSLLSLPCTQAATQFWSFDGTSLGGTGTWSSNFWGPAASGPFASAWTDNNTAVFGGTAGTVSLTAPITVDGLTFNTTGYILASDDGLKTLSFAAGSNTILLNNIATVSTSSGATTGLKLGGSGNLILSATNPVTAGTLSLQYSVAGDHSNGWSGTTTLNAATTLALAGRDLGLSSTTGITLNGGNFTLTNTNSTLGAFNRVNDSAGITSNGSTISYANSAGSGLIYGETIGSVELNRSQTNFALTTNMNGGGGNIQTLTLSDLTRTGATNASAVSFGSANGLNTTTNIITVTGKSGTGSGSGQIIGPWAFYGTTPASPTDYAVYDASGRVLNATIGATAEDSASWTAGGNNVTLGGATTLTGTRTLNTLRYTGGALTLGLGASNFNLETYGVLNGGSGLTISTTGTGGLTTPTGGGYLYLTPGSAAITVSAPINDNGGAVTLVKSGSGELTLSSTSSNFSGGIVLNGGRINTAANTNLGAAGNTVTVNGTARWNSSAAVTYARDIIVNEGAVFSVSGTSDTTFSGVLSGSGTLRNQGSSNPYIFSNTGNTFTGTVISDYGMTFANLGDSSNPIYFGGSNRWNWTGGAKTFALRPFTSNAAGVSPISNNGSGALTIQQDLAITGAAGARTLQLGGSFAAAANTFSGSIANSPGSAVAFTKGGDNSIWALSGTNTYTGATLMNQAGAGVDAGLLIFRGMQALPPSTSLNQTQANSNTTWGTIRLLDDSATPASRSGVNLNWSIQENVNTGAQANRHFMRVFVGNNSTANLGTSSSTQTGSTIRLGNLTLTEGATAATGSGLWVSGANDYRLRIADVNVTLQAGTTDTYQATLRANNPLTVTGTVRQSNDAGVGSNTRLQLEGTSAGSLISGTIDNSAGGRVMSVRKEGLGTWTLSGTNTYTGTTAINAGALIVNGNQASASGDVTVAGSATLGGTGTLGGNASIANNGRLEFNLSTSPGSHDKLELAATRTLTFSGASTLTLTSIGGASTGLYTLVTAPGASSITGSVPATVVLPLGWTADPPVIVADGPNTSLQINITSTGAGGTPEIAVEQPAASDIPNNGSRAFGTVTLGSSTSLTFTVRNSGTAALDLTGTPPNYVVVGGANAADFTVTTQPTTPVTSGGGTTTFTVQFTPGAASVRNATLTIANNDSDEGSFVINISGTGQTPYQAWAGGAPFAGDANGDGVSNGMAFLLGAANPNDSALNKLPTFSQSGGSLTMNFTMLNAASRGSASLLLQHSGDLGIGDPWTSVTVTDSTSGPTSGVTFTVTPGSPSHTVIATVSSSEALAGKLFGRLRATE